MFVLLFSTENTSVRPERLMQYPDRALTPVSVPVLAWQRPCAGPLRMREASVPSRPAIGSDAYSAEKPGWLRSARRRRTISRGEARSERDSPDPSTSCAFTLRERAEATAARAPAL